MPRTVVVAAAQMGPVARSDSRAQVVDRLIALLEGASRQQVDLVVFPELALTTFFPRWWIPDEQTLDGFYEATMPGPETARLFEAARTLRIGFHLGYAELVRHEAVTHRYNSAILVAPDGSIVGKYRKVHLPGHADHRPAWPFQHLEKRYFETGDLGFPAWRACFGETGVFGMAICNDRRWPETYRVLGLQGAEMIVIGYNTPLHAPEAPSLDRLVGFHHRLVLQAGAYQNGTWVVAAAKAGVEEGVAQLADSMIVSPNGEVVACATTNADELVMAACDLDLVKPIKETIFDFAAHREPQAYRSIVERKAAVPPT